MSSIGGMVNKTVMGVITAVIFVLIGVALGPTVISAVADINMTTLTSNGTADAVPLSSVIILLATYLPAFYYLAIVLGGIAMVWVATRSHT